MTKSARAKLGQIQYLTRRACNN